MSSTICQLSCFSSVYRNSYLHRARSASIPLRFKPAIFKMSLEGDKTVSSSSNPENTLKHRGDTFKSEVEYPVTGNVKLNEPEVKNENTQPRGSSKIHDFCLGIPFGVLIISGHILEYIFLKNLASLSTGVLYGSSVLALSTLSLKIWKQGKSCFPFILGQAVLSGALLWKDVQAYTVTKNLYPSAFYSLISAAMIGFYLYVIISGGNPPPKKQSATE